MVPGVRPSRAPPIEGATILSTCDSCVTMGARELDSCRYKQRTRHDEYREPSSHVKRVLVACVQLAPLGGPQHP